MKTRQSQRIVRKRRIRAKINGTAKRPRLALYRSNRGLFAQVIDDDKGVTIASHRSKGNTKEKAKTAGQELAELLTKKKITTVVFDRGGWRYHGAVAAFADAVREGGIKL